MGGINSLGGLNNVSVDFRPTITTIVQKPDKANQPQKVAGADAAIENPPPVNANAKSVVRELDVLLLNAARMSIGSGPSYYTRDFFDQMFESKEIY